MARSLLSRMQSFVTRKLRLLKTRTLSDRTTVKRQFHKRIGRPLDLTNPKGFHEKVCWLRLNRLTPLHTYCADKATAAAYVASRIGPGHTPHCYFTTQNPGNLDPAAIPAKQCVIKPNHTSQVVAVIDDTATADWPAIRQRMGASLHQNLYWKTRERQYKAIVPTIMVEEKIEMDARDGGGEIKIFCLSGKARFAQYWVPGALVAKETGMIFDLSFTPLHVTRLHSPIGPGAPTRPAFFDRMIEITETLAEPFALLRVDFLVSSTRFYVSELTFTPGAGYNRFIPEEFELEMGALINHTADLPDWRPYLAAARAFEAAHPTPRLSGSGVLPAHAATIVRQKSG